ncbi:HemK2/MTQ2 family protein methyltransferase [Prescottella agglutinans]|uniref:HemK2/MTQ2 family protein methyltransferase n=2 Tax=Prescottella agglutinans TaxID=1644129 RepID=UPI003D956644
MRWTTARRLGEPTDCPTGHRQRLLRLPGVYPPQSDSFLLAGALGCEPMNAHTRVADVGAGTGLLSVSAGLAGADSVTAVDIDRRSLLNTRLNAVLNGVRVQVVRGNLLQPLRGKLFDVVVSNPPYVPSADDDQRGRGLARCWDAGHDGRAYLDRICRDAPDVLASGGVLLLVQSALCGTGLTRTLLEQQGLDVDIVATASIPFGPVLTERAAMLRERGLVGNEDREEIVVIRAVK